MLLKVLKMKHIIPRHTNMSILITVIIVISLSLGIFAGYKYGVQIGILVASESLNKFLKSISEMDASYINMLMLKYNADNKAARAKTAKYSKFTVVDRN